MPNVEIHGSPTLVPGVTGAAGYHALLTTLEGRVTWYVPSMSGRDAESVEASLGFPIDAIVIDAWRAQGIGNAYAWNEDAAVAAEVTVGVGAPPPSLIPGDGGYLATKTYLRFGGHDYLADPPFDVVLFLPNFASGAGVRAILDVVTKLTDGTYGGVRTENGPVRQGRPSKRLTDVTVAEALLAWIASFPGLFGVVEAAERLGLILSNQQIGVYAPIGINVGGANPESDVRAAMLDALEGAVSVIGQHFANAFDAERLSTRLTNLRRGHTSGVLVNGNLAHDHLSDSRWRSLFISIFLDVLALFSSACG